MTGANPLYPWAGQSPSVNTPASIAFRAFYEASYLQELVRIGCHVDRLRVASCVIGAKLGYRSGDIKSIELALLSDLEKRCKGLLKFPS